MLYHFWTEYLVYVQVTFPKSIHLPVDFGQLCRALRWAGKQVSPESLCFPYTSEHSASSFACMLRARIAGLYGQAMFNFWTNLQAALHGTWTILDLFQQCSRLPTSPRHCQHLLFSCVLLKQGSNYAAPTSQVAKIVDICHLPHRAYCFLGPCFVYSIIATLMDVK